MIRDGIDLFRSLKGVFQAILVLGERVENLGDILSDSIVCAPYGVDNGSEWWNPLVFFMDLSRTMRSADLRIVREHCFELVLINLVTFPKCPQEILESCES